MQRWLCIAASYLIITLPVWAQYHGGGTHAMASGGMQSHPMRSFSGGSRRYNFGSFDTNFHISQDFGRRPGYPQRRGGRDFDRGSHGRSRSIPGAYFPYYGSYWDPSYLSDDRDLRDRDRYDQDVDYATADQERFRPPYREDSGLQRDVQTLNGRIDRLQADIEDRPNEQGPTTALVFLDQHVLEVRNYAISGGTLWVLSAQQPKKIPLAELDLNATAKMNDDRGVDFQIPK